jgi:hypothetical protein
MAARTFTDIARERDRALRHLQILAGEIRAHERMMGHHLASPRRLAEERLDRRLRQVKDRGADVASAP